MFPFHIRLGPLALSPVELTGFLGMALVAVLSRRRLAALGVSGGDLLDLLLAAVVGGAVGARLYYFVPLWVRGLERGERLLGNWSDGSGFFGGLVLGAAAVLVVARLKKKPLLPIADVTLARLPVGFAMGKLGCFLAGCCYGPPCAGGVAFRRGSLAYQTHLKEGRIGPGADASLAVHPTQLYELLLALGLAAGLVLFERRSRRPGEAALGFFLGYSVWRFFIEFLRDDPGRDGFGAGLTDSQVAAIVVGGASLVLWALLRRRGSPA
ncbi:MAG TPA: prolipoprotein diacylglyceryl transferase family protein, partial [Planctomycetota bacterium]|nr:prolipoprotein diacylglyceryl transferase family protein [Planctomycetota bacterium]